MYSAETIRSLNSAAAEQARSEGKAPLMVTEVTDSTLLRNTPYLGDLCDAFDLDLERVDTLFVDNSGFGQRGEAALTYDQFRQRVADLIAEHGPVQIAIESAGQFQVHIAVWSNN